MKFSPDNVRRPAAFTLTSMLDVIFLLLCFFVTVSVYSQWESEISIKLPGAETADRARSRQDVEVNIIVNVTSDGKIRFNGMQVSHDDLQTKLYKNVEAHTKVNVVIRADRDARYEFLVKVIDTCRKAGVYDFSLATTEDKAENK